MGEKELRNDGDDRDDMVVERARKDIMDLLEVIINSHHDKLKRFPTSLSLAHTLFASRFVFNKMLVYTDEQLSQGVMSKALRDLVNRELHERNNEVTARFLVADGYIVKIFNMYQMVAHCCAKEEEEE